MRLSLCARYMGVLGAACAAVVTLNPDAAASAPAVYRPGVDYASPASWVCRAGAETVCATGLDALVITPDGARVRRAFTPAPDPPIDCFYVYPTASHEPTPFSDLAASPEVQEVTRAQAGRLTSRCRVFAPLYRQVTMTGLQADMASGAHLDLRGPYADVRDAWRWYLAHANAGRGVVLIGHSQGAILLQRLIVEEIDGRPAQARLVSAFLAGDPSLAVPRGAVVGGTFKHVPLCAAAAQTGCVYVWGSYLADDADPARRFGRDPGDGSVAACVDPATPAGGSAVLDAFLPRPKSAPADDPPWVEVKDQLTGACVADAQGAALRITVLPTRYADRLRVGLAHYISGPGWGLHRLDLSLPQGDILQVIGAEAEAWRMRRCAPTDGC